MNNEIDSKKNDQPLETRAVDKNKQGLTDSDLENVSGGFLDAHGDVCVSVGAGMSTVTTGGTNKNNG